MTEDVVADSLRAAKGRLAVRCIDEMFANPFWMERFGARGRVHSEADIAFHVDYVAQSLIARDRTILETYARWLQSVLTTRGMCTRHLDDSFAVLAGALGHELPEAHAEIARRYLEGARKALTYRDGAAADLGMHSSAIAARVVALVGSGLDDARRERCADDIAYHLSYLVDAIALDRPQLFLAYVELIGGFLEKRHVPREALRQTLAALAKTIAEMSALSEPARRAAALVLEQAA